MFYRFIYALIPNSYLNPFCRYLNLEPRPYIFLDIDGVLNTYHHRIRQKQFAGKSSIHVWCPDSCRNIVRLCKEFNANIVISSNWKDQYQLEELKEIFERNDIPADYIMDLTPSEVERHSGAEYRGREIQRWLDEHVPDGVPYLIIDDDSTVLESQKDHLVQVNPEDGFANPQAVARARRILSNGRYNGQDGKQ